MKTPSTTMLKETISTLTLDDISKGAAWYPDAMRLLQSKCPFGVDENLVAKVCATLSPRARWAMNVQATSDFLWGAPRTRGVLQRSWDRARVFLFSPLNPLQGPKVTEFYQALMGNTGAVVLDIWMCRALGWPPPDTAKQYSQLKQAWQGVVPSNLSTMYQAAIWIKTRSSYKKGAG